MEAKAHVCRHSGNTARPAVRARPVRQSRRPVQSRAQQDHARRRGAARPTRRAAGQGGVRGDAGEDRRSRATAAGTAGNSGTAASGRSETARPGRAGKAQPGTGSAARVGRGGHGSAAGGPHRYLQGNTARAAAPPPRRRVVRIGLPHGAGDSTSAERTAEKQRNAIPQSAPRPADARVRSPAGHRPAPPPRHVVRTGSPHGAGDRTSAERTAEKQRNAIRRSAPRPADARVRRPAGHRPDPPPRRVVRTGSSHGAGDFASAERTAEKQRNAIRRSVPHPADARLRSPARHRPAPPPRHGVRTGSPHGARDRAPAERTARIQRNTLRRSAPRLTDARARSPAGHRPGLPR